MKKILMLAIAFLCFGQANAISIALSGFNGGTGISSISDDGSSIIVGSSATSFIINATANMQIGAKETISSEIVKIVITDKNGNQVGYSNSATFSTNNFLSGSYDLSVTITCTQQTTAFVYPLTLKAYAIGYSETDLANADAVTGSFSVTKQASSQDPVITGNSITNTGSASYLGSGTPSFTGTSAGGGNGTFSYQWQSKTTGGYSPIATGQNYAATAPITQTTTYKRVVTSGNAAASSSNEITITINAFTCPASLNLTGSLTNAEYKASGAITASTATVASGSNVLVRGNKVVLQPNFKAAQGSTFKATINPCQAGTRLEAEDVSNLEIGGKFSLFPNPSTGLFTVVFPDASANYAIHISDILGNKVYSETVSGISNKELSLGNIASGLYLVRVSGGGSNYNQKVQIIK